jgi:ribosome-binding factor A
MTQRKKISQRKIRSLCSQPGDLDGLDPRFDRPERWRGGLPRKALQLCAQVSRTVGEVLAGSADELLRDLMVASVVPAPDSTRLMVTLTPSPSAGEMEVGEVMARLEQARPLIRSEVAAGIHRRKTPDLVFQVAGK